MFEPVWQPIIPMRWVKRNGEMVLQQAWARYVMGDSKWEQTNEHRWEDVPIMDENAPSTAEHWNKKES